MDSREPREVKTRLSMLSGALERGLILGRSGQGVQPLLMRNVSFGQINRYSRQLLSNIGRSGLGSVDSWPRVEGLIAHNFEHVIQGYAGAYALLALFLHAISE